MPIISKFGLIARLYRRITYKPVPSERAMVHLPQQTKKERAEARAARNAILPSISSAAQPFYYGPHSDKFVVLSPREYSGLEKQKLCSGYGEREARQVAEIFDFAQNGHLGVYRDSGDPYFIHPVEVASIVKQWYGTSAEVGSSLAHDLVEDCTVWLPDPAGGFWEADVDGAMLSERFGQVVGEIVDGVTELGKEQDYVGEKPSLAAKFRKFLSYAVRNLSVVKVKFADRLHNMRTLASVPNEKKRFDKALETMKIYVRLANRLGAWEIKRELEELCYRYLDPVSFKLISERRNELIKQSEETVNGIVKEMQNNLGNPRIQIDYHIEKRGVFELHQRMKLRGITSAAELTAIDIWRIQIVVPQKSDCYRLLEKLHGLYSPEQSEHGSRFKDHIADPRPNGHRFLHTYVLVPDFGTLLVQIRDKSMYDFYRFGRFLPGAPLVDDSWMTALLDDLRAEEEISPEEFFGLVDDFCASRTFIAPDGQAYSLPHGSTPLDYLAKAMPSALVYAKGALVNGKLVGLLSPLGNGGQIEVIMSEVPQTSLEWLSAVRNEDTKVIIKKYLRREAKSHPMKARIIGQAALAQAMVTETKPRHIPVDDLLKSSLFLNYVARLGCGKDSKQLLVWLGSGKLIAQDILAGFLEYYEAEKIAVLGKKARVLPFYFSLDLPDQSGALANVFNLLTEAGYNVRESDTDNPVVKDGQTARVVLGIDILGGRRGGEMIGQFQRLEVRSIVAQAEAKLEPMTRDELVDFLLKKSLRLLEEMRIDPEAIRSHLVLLENTIVAHGLEGEMLTPLIGMIQRVASRMGNEVRVVVDRPGRIT